MRGARSCFRNVWPLSRGSPQVLDMQGCGGTEEAGGTMPGRGVTVRATSGRSKPGKDDQKNRKWCGSRRWPTGDATHRQTWMMGMRAALVSGLKGTVASVCEVGAVSSQSESHHEVGPRGHLG